MIQLNMHSGGRALENVECETVLLSGCQDMRVNPHNALSYFKSLQANNKIAELYCFKGEGHLLSGPAPTAFILEKTLKLLRKLKK